MEQSSLRVSLCARKAHYISLFPRAHHTGTTRRTEHEHTQSLKLRACVSLKMQREKDNNERDATEPEMPAAVVVVLSIISVNAPLLYTHTHEIKGARAHFSR